jgi:choline dehydrogenase
VGAVGEYLLARRGLLTSNVCDAAAIVRPAGCTVPPLRIVCQWRARPEARDTCISFETVLIDPSSRGRLSLAAAGSDEPMLIDPGYLTDGRDLERLAEGIELARAIAASPSCRKAGVGQELGPGGDDVAGYVRRHANSAYHPVGTCRLGTDQLAVVDPRLRVVGVDGLRVADASVMPTTVAGNAQAAVLAIAERAAHLIRA